MGQNQKQLISSAQKSNTLFIYFCNRSQCLWTVSNSMLAKRVFKQTEKMNSSKIPGTDSIHIEF